MKIKKLNMMSNTQGPRTKILMGLFVGTLALVVANLVFVNIYSAEDQTFIQKSSDLRVISQEMAKHAAEVSSASSGAFTGISATRTSFDATWGLLNNGAESYVDTGLGFKTALPGRGSQIQRVQPNIEILWNKVKANANTILENQVRIQTLNKLAANVSQEMPSLQRNYEEVVNTLLDVNEPLATIAIGQRQSWLLERISLNLGRITTGTENTQAAVEQFQRDINLFLVNHDALTRGDASLGVTPVSNENAKKLLANITSAFNLIKENANTIVAAAPEITRTSAAVDEITNDSELMLAETTALSEYFTSQRGNHIASPTVGYALLLVILILISLYGLDVISQSRKAEKMAEEVNQRNNNAVMNLLDEISELANGDLTVNATVSEDFTGAIADAINYSIGQLRVLVSAITNVSIEVTDSTKDSEKTVHYLAAASERQSQSISSVYDSVREMERSISRVADNANKSLQVAKDSVTIASGGALVVKNTIKGMDTIRDQIQETSKRIKRLGESSQEIGGFVALINDIADHTNTLSLNAAIQAAMAGEAGRGFAVVADEVHALAERSGEATRKIESLVRVIQRDINEAVYSMEQTTSEVVQGTKLAQNAGSALDDIERVSKELATIVENIAEAARNQEQSASKISNSMETINSITTETYSGTKATSDFIVNLSDLTARLRSAVAGFSLAQEQVKAVAQSPKIAISTEDHTVNELSASRKVAQLQESMSATSTSKNYDLSKLAAV